MRLSQHSSDDRVFIVVGGEAALVATLKPFSHTGAVATVARARRWGDAQQFIRYLSMNVKRCSLPVACGEAVGGDGE